MSPKKDQYNEIREAVEKLVNPPPPTLNLETQINDRIKQLQARGIPELIIQETIKMEFIPDYLSLSIRLDTAKSMFGGGHQESLSAVYIPKR